MAETAAAKEALKISNVFLIKHIQAQIEANPGAKFVFMSGSNRKSLSSEIRNTGNISFYKNSEIKPSAHSSFVQMENFVAVIKAANPNAEIVYDAVIAEDLLLNLTPGTIIGENKQAISEVSSIESFKFYDSIVNAHARRYKTHRTMGSVYAEDDKDKYGLMIGYCHYLAGKYNNPTVFFYDDKYHVQSIQAKHLPKGLTLHSMEWIHDESSKAGVIKFYPSDWLKSKKITDKCEGSSKVFAPDLLYILILQGERASDEDIYDSLMIISECYKTIKEQSYGKALAVFLYQLMAQKSLDLDDLKAFVDSIKDKDVDGIKKEIAQIAIENANVVAINVFVFDYNVSDEKIYEQLLANKFNAATISLCQSLAQINHDLVNLYLQVMSRLIHVEHHSYKPILILKSDRYAVAINSKIEAWLSNQTAVEKIKEFLNSIYDCSDNEKKLLEAIDDTDLQHDFNREQQRKKLYDNLYKISNYGWHEKTLSYEKPLYYKAAEMVSNNKNAQKLNDLKLIDEMLAVIQDDNLRQRYNLAKDKNPEACPFGVLNGSLESLNSDSKTNTKSSDNRCYSENATPFLKLEQEENKVNPSETRDKSCIVC
ncbi:MAG: hypothetical protein ACO2ZM_07935 [Francisellaceae bacterium]